MNKQQLLDSIRSERSRLDALIAALGDDALLAPSLEGGRSVKDVVAHITAWNKVCASKIRNVASGDAPEGSAGGGFTEADMHKFNEAVFEANRERSLADIREEWRRSHDRVLAAITQLSEEELNRPVGGGSNERALMIDSVREDTDTHYRGHISQIEAWRTSADGAE